jgi:hypothetical protein
VFTAAFIYPEEEFKTDLEKPGVDVRNASDVVNSIVCAKQR